ncbi:TPA: hypothetical protein I8235_004223 [Kluyvera intermedia]|nr:hypothetical protein [Kluyvera intermedia]
MKKQGKALMSILTVMIFFLTIPEIVIRVLTPEQFARLSDFTSLGGVFSHILSVLIFLGLTSALLGVLTIFLITKIYRRLSISSR